MSNSSIATYHPGSLVYWSRKHDLDFNATYLIEPKHSEALLTGLNTIFEVDVLSANPSLALAYLGLSVSEVFRPSNDSSLPTVLGLLKSAIRSELQRFSNNTRMEARDSFNFHYSLTIVAYLLWKYVYIAGNLYILTGIRILKGSGVVCVWLRDQSYQFTEWPFYDPLGKFNPHGIRPAEEDFHQILGLETAKFWNLTDVQSTTFRMSHCLIQDKPYFTFLGGDYEAAMQKFEHDFPYWKEINRNSLPPGIASGIPSGIACQVSKYMQHIPLNLRESIKTVHNRYVRGKTFSESGKWDRQKSLDVLIDGIDKIVHFKDGQPFLLKKMQAEDTGLHIYFGTGLPTDLLCFPYSWQQLEQFTQGWLQSFYSEAIKSNTNLISNTGE